MTILEQILAGLQTKFSGVDTATLTRIATKKAEGVTDASQVNSIVEGISFTDVVNNYGDFRANSAVTSAVSNYEKKHGLKDGKPIENPNPNPNPNPVQPDMAKMIADAVKAAVEPLSTELAGFKQKEAQTVRGAQIQAKAKEYGIPESQAKRYSVPEDADLDTYFKDVAQELKNEGFAGVVPPETSDAKIKTETESIANMINEGTKTIVEQNKN
ncbi:hypothetical protein [Bacteroides sp.]|uniref:hypothetical protein n=1 Tax=Bacteroides sp. TaxID=29523 RepID=UPI00262D0987|nr:hypothetical protein [Bacteroides sp.]